MTEKNKQSNLQKEIELIKKGVDKFSELIVAERKWLLSLQSPKAQKKNLNQAKKLLNNLFKSFDEGLTDQFKGLLKVNGDDLLRATTDVLNILKGYIKKTKYAEREMRAISPPCCIKLQGLVDDATRITNSVKEFEKNPADKRLNQLFAKGTGWSREKLRVEKEVLHDLKKEVTMAKRKADEISELSKAIDEAIPQKLPEIVLKIRKLEDEQAFKLIKQVEPEINQMWKKLLSVSEKYMKADVSQGSKFEDIFSSSVYDVFLRVASKKLLDSV